MGPCIEKGLCDCGWNHAVKVRISGSEKKPELLVIRVVPETGQNRGMQMEYIHAPVSAG